MKTRYLIFCLFLTIRVNASVHTVHNFSTVKDLIVQGEIVKGFQNLKNIPTKTMNTKDRHLHAFMMAFLSQKLGHASEVHAFLSKDKEPLRKEYRHFLSGKAFYGLKDYRRAAKEFESMLSMDLTKEILYQIHFELAQIAMKTRQWKLAYKYLRFTEKKWRNTHKHPQVIWDLIKVYIQKKRNPCFWVRKIYSTYPAHSLVYDWDIQLKKAQYEKRPLGCQASPKDQAQRIRRLQWSGESERARHEIQSLRHQAKTKTYEIDLMFVKFLINEGDIDEAMDILTGYYKQKNRNFDYLILLGKAASKAGEYQMAVNAYYQAYRYSSKSQLGQEALFNAAFLSYQFQDYDGASKKFEELIKKYRTSRLKRDAQYYLAWTRYLKGHYWSAVQKFDDVLKHKEKHQRLWSKYPIEKIQYWLAMSHKRLKNNERAYQLFLNLKEDQNNDGFYSLVADYRVRSVPGLSHFRRNPALSKAPQSFTFLKFNKNMDFSKEDVFGNKLKLYEKFIQNKRKLSIQESIKNMVNQENTSFVFEEPESQKRFDRAIDFLRVGLLDWAKGELYEIERRTKNKAALRKLIQSYEDIGSFNRSAYISAIYFSEEKSQVEKKNDPLWMSAYPRAYEEIVHAASKEFQVPPELIWSIIRAETFFKKQAISPVGAKGLMQLMPYTARRVASLMGSRLSFRETALFEPKTNIRLGTRYLKRLLKKFNGSIPLAAAAYNAGPHRVEDWISKFGNLDMDEFIEHIPFLETKNYVKKVINNFNNYQEIYFHNNDPSFAWLFQPIAVEIRGKPATRETWEPLNK